MQRLMRLLFTGIYFVIASSNAISNNDLVLLAEKAKNNFGLLQAEVPLSPDISAESGSEFKECLSEGKLMKKGAESEGLKRHKVLESLAKLGLLGISVAYYYWCIPYDIDAFCRVNSDSESSVRAFLRSHICD